MRRAFKDGQELDRNGGKVHLRSWAERLGCVWGTAAEAQCISWAGLWAPPNSHAEALSHTLQNVPLCGNRGVAGVIG